MGLLMRLAYSGFVDFAKEKLIIMLNTSVGQIRDVSMNSVRNRELDCFQPLNRSEYHRID